MLQTIQLGKYIYVQGERLRSLPDGTIEVRVDNSVYTGTPVNQAVDQAA